MVITANICFMTAVHLALFMLYKSDKFLANGNWLNDSMEYYTVIKDDGYGDDKGIDISYNEKSTLDQRVYGQQDCSSAKETYGKGGGV